ncbi:MAG: DUF6090 family protein [Ignavibacteriaceae bacterium]|nr:DUF6090 family protein [Ignavibacteriaceae bacterium]
MKQKIQWKNHFIELLVVVIGITIAFMLENWRQENANKELEQKYLSSLKSDLTSDKKLLGSTISSVEKQSSILGEFVAEIGIGNVSKQKAEEMIPQVLISHGFAPKQATYQSITNSGNLNIINDYKLIESLASYYNSYDELSIKEKVLYDYQLKFVLPFVYENVDFLSGEIVNKSAINGFEFKNIVTGYYTLLRQNLEVYKNYEQANKELLEIINKYLN